MNYRFLQSMKWREEWSINKDDGWKMPQVMNDYTPCGISGYDKGGSPVIVIPFSGFDICGLLKSVHPKDMVRFLAERIDQYLEIARLSSLKHGPKASQVTVIVDLTDFSLRQFTWKPGNLYIMILVCKTPIDSIFFFNLFLYDYLLTIMMMLKYNIIILTTFRLSTITIRHLRHFPMLNINGCNWKL